MIVSLVSLRLPPPSMCGKMKGKLDLFILFLFIQSILNKKITKLAKL